MVLRLGLVIWGTLLLGGFGILIIHSNTPGEPADASLAWPKNSAIQMQTDRMNLVMFVHPECSCTLSSLHELSRLVAQIHEPVRVTVAVAQYSDLESSQSPNLEAARDIPGVEVFMDKDAENSDLFGSKTSGQTFLYDSNGRLLYSGGITSARGHEGDNDGQKFIVSTINARRSIASQLVQLNVFGCGLKNSSQLLSFGGYSWN